MGEKQSKYISALTAISKIPVLEDKSDKAKRAQNFVSSN